MLAVHWQEPDDPTYLPDVSAGDSSSVPDPGADPGDNKDPTTGEPVGGAGEPAESDSTALTSPATSKGGAVAAPEVGQVQVAPEHYDFERYDDLERWNSYWYQIRAALRLEPRSVLEIGSGSGVFRAYLRGVGIDVKSVDIDDTRDPDFIADVTRLDETLPAGLRFDVVAAFQVLEHVPFDQFEACLVGLRSRADRYVLLSLPCNGFQARFSFAIGGLRISRGIYLRLPWRMRHTPEHYWELGPYESIRKITRILRKHFTVEDRFYIKENPYHYMWILRVDR